MVKLENVTFDQNHYEVFITVQDLQVNGDDNEAYCSSLTREKLLNKLELSVTVEQKCFFITYSEKLNYLSLLPFSFCRFNDFIIGYNIR